jgi:hypothetical protein
MCLVARYLRSMAASFCLASGGGGESTLMPLIMSWQNGRRKTPFRQNHLLKVFVSLMHNNHYQVQ